MVCQQGPQVTQADLSLQPVLPGVVISAPLECHCHSHAPAQAREHKAQAKALSGDQSRRSGLEEKRKSAGELRVSPRRPGSLEQERVSLKCKRSWNSCSGFPAALETPNWTTITFQRLLPLCLPPRPRGLTQPLSPPTGPHTSMAFTSG